MKPKLQIESAIDQKRRKTLKYRSPGKPSEMQDTSLTLPEDRQSKRWVIISKVRSHSKYLKRFLITWLKKKGNISDKYVIVFLCLSDGLN